MDVGIAKPNTLQRELIKAIQEKLNANKKAEIIRRNEFILLIFNLASSATKTQESATLASLRLELLLPIFSDMDFSCIGKETEVGLNCIRFLFNHSETIKFGLSQSKYKHQPIIIENIISNSHLTQFSLLKPSPLLATEKIDAMELKTLNIDLVVKQPK